MKMSSIRLVAPQNHCPNAQSLSKANNQVTDTPEAYNGIQKVDTFTIYINKRPVIPNRATPWNTHLQPGEPLLTLETMSGSNLPAPDEKQVSTEENSVVKWLNNVVEPFEQVDEEAPPIPTRNPLRLLIRREPTYDELEVSPGSDGMDTAAKSWHKHDSDLGSGKKQDDKTPREEGKDKA